MTDPHSKFSPISIFQEKRSLTLTTVYYIRRLLYQNLDRLQSLVAKGAAIKADPFCDLNAMLESLYLEPIAINTTIEELEHLIFSHQTLRLREIRYRQELKSIEQKIFWLLGFKLSQTVYPANILLVDDTPINLKLLSMALMQQGYQIYTASSGVEALEIANEVHLNLILLDLIMPRIDGCEICKSLKANAKTANIPIIFMSAMNDSADKVRAFNAGGSDFVTKPFQLEEVLARIECQLKLRDLQQRLEEKNILYQTEIKERRQAEALYRDFFENAIYGMFQTSPTGKYLKVNLALVQMYGYESAQDLLQGLKNISQHLYVEPRRREEFVARIEEEGSIVDFESQVYRKDGRIIWISETVRGVRDLLGELIFYEGIIRDLTAQKEGS
ncbi:MAG: response regulator [Leptolyngbyaceae cyanobacterium CSU_1_4]|nr:response regulator [Leptolyngbyaceae cyanobacterium CSU_1_4]